MAGTTTDTGSDEHGLFKKSGKITTLRHALGPVLRLASDLGSPNGHGCSIYQLAREMAKRFASQPTDKIAGLFFLLRTPGHEPSRLEPALKNASRLVPRHTPAHKRTSNLR